MAMTLVIGGIGSGKSAYVEGIIEKTNRRAVYIATSEAIDDEMRAKIEKHRQRRGKGWRTLEEPRDLAGALAACGTNEAVLVECISTWLTNLLMDTETSLEEPVDRLIATLAMRQADTYLVTNEAGSGIMPPNALSRRYVALMGEVNQRLAACAGTVILVVAGMPIALKGTLPQ